jgi:hypothetical protein
MTKDSDVDNKHYPILQPQLKVGTSVIILVRTSQGAKQKKVTATVINCAHSECRLHAGYFPGVART